MYLVGLALQAAVLGALVAAAIAYEAPVREALDLPPARPASAVAASLDEIGARLAAIEEDLDALTRASARASEARAETLATLGDVGEVARAIEATLADGDDDDLARQLAAVERLVARVESKVDDVRDAQLFPAPTADDAMAP